MLTEEKLKDRTNYIGSSDAAGVLGLSRWSTPIKVWGEKTGQLVPDSPDRNLAIEVGNELEDLVCKLFTKRTGKQVRRVNETIFHPSYPFLAANVDRRIVGEDAILEAKTASGWKAREWEGEQIPQEYIIQAMHQLAVTGKNLCYVAVLIGGNQDFRWKLVQRDEKMIRDMLRQEVRFWRNFVEKKAMPLQIKRNDTQVLYDLFPVGDESEEIELDEKKANLLIDNLESYKEDLKALKGTVERYENELKAMLKDRAVGLTSKWRVTWKNQISRRLDGKRLREHEPKLCERYTKSVESRVLRIRSIEGNKGGK